jgi:hypothetical protein
MKGAIKYLASSEAIERERILRDYKYPDTSGPSDYYNWSHDAIRAYHKAGNDIDILRQAMLNIESKMQGANQQAAAKLEHNRRVLDSYQSYFRDRVLAPLEHEPKLVDCEGVLLNLRPDLVAREGKVTRIIQFVSGERPVTDAQERAMAKHIGYAKQFLLFYANQAGLKVRPADCQVFVIATGEFHAASGAAKTFEAKLKSAMREARRTWGEI